MAVATWMGLVWETSTGVAIFFIQNFFFFRLSESILFRATAGRIHTNRLLGSGFNTGLIAAVIFFR
jgi:hypothetical protein